MYTTEPGWLRDKFQLCLTFTMSLLIASCSGMTLSSKNDDKAKNFESSLQTRDLAVARSRSIRDIHYDLSVELDENSMQYTGALTAEFNHVVPPGQELKRLWIDFRGGEVVRLAVNDQVVDRPTREGSLLYLPTTLLKRGANKVFVSFNQKYNTSGVGLHRFKDPEDGNVYLYTQFEPYDASRFAPFFDQPDLRATLKLKVKAPTSWVVITATDPERVSQDGPERKFWNFKKTAPIATYLFSLHAGPYKEYKSQYTHRIPLRLFVRQSLAKYVPVDDWFKWTRQGFQYFEKYFGVNYPFGKYDQVIVPEFNFGAMENVAAITYSERYIKRGGMTYNERQSLASVILHEMAHQWFGDLVTMKWWDDLWLNESFATFMAAKAMAEATEFKDAWVEFNGDKNWAMMEDQLVTTHPIAATVENTDQAFNNFDGITYGKGASVLQQLEYLIGEKPFQEGIKHYFKKHAYQNTTLKDFIAALQTKANLDLQKWSVLWLEQRGIDSVQASTQCSEKNAPGGGRLLSVTLNVEKSPGVQFRPQAVEVAALQLRNGKISVQSRQRVTLESESTVINWQRPAPCPAMIYVNANDKAYIKTLFSNADVEILKKYLAEVQDTHLRLMMWTSLWQMVTNQLLAPATYAEIVLNNVRNEKDMKIYGQALSTFLGGRGAAYSNAIYYLPDRTEEDKALRRTIVRRAESLLLDILQSTPPGSDKYKATLAALTQVAESERALNELYLLAQDERKLDIDRRWSVLESLCRHDHPRANELKNALLAADSSSRARSSALSCEAARPDVNRKKELLAQVTNPESSLSAEQQKAIIRALIDDSREEMYRELHKDIRSYVTGGLALRDEDFQDDFASHLAPVTCEEKDLEDFRKFVKSARLTDVAKRAYEVTLDLRARCVNLRKQFSAN